MKAAPRPHRISGFSLIEVLIALVILSVGLLGIAAMVSVSLKAKDGAYMQTQATTLAQTMLDRMRANRSAVTLGSYDIALSAATPTAPACMGDISPGCSSAQIATFDIADWRNNLANTLPSGTGGITTVAVAQMTQVTISIAWNDKRANAAVAAVTATSAPAAATTTYTIVSGL